MTTIKTKTKNRLGYDAYHKILLLMQSKRARWVDLRAKQLCEKLGQHGFQVTPIHVYKFRKSLGWPRLNKPKVDKALVRDVATWRRINKLKARVEFLEKELAERGSMSKVKRLLKIAGIA